MFQKSAWGARASNLLKAGVATPLERIGFHAAEAVPGNLIQATALEGASAAVTKYKRGGTFDPVCRSYAKHCGPNVFWFSSSHSQQELRSFHFRPEKWSFKIHRCP